MDRCVVILDLFAGPGGWSEGLRMLGLPDVGIEWDDAACRTRAAAGHLTIRADVVQYPPQVFAGKVEGLIASPPCQDFSLAGKRAGRAGESGRLIDTVPAWVDALRPSWVVFEQVPPALPVWREFAWMLKSWAYSTWAGVLNAADFGVPQTRERAFLIASRDGIVHPPEQTHISTPSPRLWGHLLPWVSMAEALGWSESDQRVLRNRRDSKGWITEHGDRPNRSTDQPAPTITGEAHRWPWERPSTTIAGDPRVTARCHHEEGSQGRNAKTTEQVRAGEYGGTEPIKLTATEALVLQSFPADYPVQGSRSKQFEQIGNAVPPLLAAHIVAALTGASLEERAA